MSPQSPLQSPLRSGSPHSLLRSLSPQSPLRSGSPQSPPNGLLLCLPYPGTPRAWPTVPTSDPPTAHPPPRHFSVFSVCGASGIRSLKGGGSWYCWCARAAHQMSLCWAHGLWFVVGAMCSPVYCLPPTILLTNHCFSCLLPSFVSLFNLLVSAVMCWSVVFRRVCMCYGDCYSSLPACLFFPFGVVFVHLFYFTIKKTRSSASESSSHLSLLTHPDTCCLSGLTHDFKSSFQTLWIKWGWLVLRITFIFSSTEYRFHCVCMCFKELAVKIKTAGW